MVSLIIFLSAEGGDTVIIIDLDIHAFLFVFRVSDDHIFQGDEVHNMIIRNIREYGERLVINHDTLRNSCAVSFLHTILNGVHIGLKNYAAFIGLRIFTVGHCADTGHLISIIGLHHGCWTRILITRSCQYLRSFAGRMTW